MKKVKLYVCILLVILLIGITSSVQAETQGLDFTPTANTKNLNEGDEVIISLQISNINMGEDGINTFGGKLIYDEAVFEKVKPTNFSSQNNWSIAYNDEETNKKGTFLATSMMGTKDNQTIGTITLKVKTNIETTTTTITFSELSSVGEDTFELSDKTITLNITGTLNNTPSPMPSPVPSPQPSPVPSPTPIVNITTVTTPTPIPTPTQVSNNNTVVTTTSPKKLPQTGKEETTVLVVAFGILIITSIIVYIKLREMKGIK